MDKIEEFWTRKRVKFTHLRKLVLFAYICTVSSGSVERLFSILANTFDLQQLRFALEDYSSTSSMMVFNEKFIRAHPYL